MSNWFDVVEEYVPNDVLRNQLHRAIRTTLGEDFAPDLIHPVEEPSGLLLMFRGEEVFLLRYYDPPPSATIIFLGSLTGGLYSETVTKHEVGQVLDGELDHERLGKHNPLRIRYALESDLTTAAGAVDRAGLLRDRLRKWSTEPERSSPRPR